MPRLVFLFLIFVKMSHCVTQLPKEILQDTPKPSTKFSIPLEIQNQLVFVRLYSETGIPMQFLVDTGSNISFFWKEKDFFPKSHEKKNIQINEYSFKEVPFFRITFHTESKEKIQDFSMAALDFYPEGVTYDGILGNDFFEKFVIVLNFPNSLDILENSTNLDFSEIPSKFSNGHIFLKKNSEMYLLDTGAAISALPNIIGESQNISKKVLYFDGQIDSEQIYKSKNPFCVTDKEFCVSQLDFLKGLELEGRGFLVSGEKKVTGVLGRNYFENFILLIDYPKKRIGLKYR